MSKLKPCPFCGESPEWGYITHTGGHYLLCDAEGCRQSTTDAYPDQGDAISAWNTRADTGVKVKALEWWSPSAENNWTYGAETIFGVYYIHQCGGRATAWIELPHRGSHIEEWEGEVRGSVEAAMLDAERHCERLIFSTLEPTPVGW